MLHEFLSANRQELERRCRDKVLERPNRVANKRQLEQGVPLFLDQLIRALRAESMRDDALGVAISGAASGDAHHHSELGASAATSSARNSGASLSSTPLTYL